MQNKQRILVKCVKAAAAEIGAEVSMHCDDWVITLKRAGQVRHIVGYDFPLNSSTAKQVAQDKAALSEVLAAAGVPRVEHKIVHHPKMAEYVPLEGNWPWLMEYLRVNGRVVIKPNEGTGGADVYRVGSIAELENALSIVHSKTRAAAVCPYVDVVNEYRLIVLRGEVVLCYRKLRSTVTGDGKLTVAQLAVKQLAGIEAARSVLVALRQTSWDEPDFSLIPPAGKMMPVNWRHNLGQGAGVEIISTREPRYQDLQTLAIKAATALGVAFASVDVVEAVANPLHGIETFRVLEVNGGVMMESLARQLPGGMELAQQIYTRAVKAMFEVR